MVVIELWKEREGLVCRERRPATDVKPIVRSFVSEASTVRVRYNHGWSVGERYQVWVGDSHLNIEFVSKNQLRKFREFFEGISTGEIEEKYTR